MNGVKTEIVKTNQDGTKSNSLETNASEDFMSIYGDLFKVQSLEEIRNQLATPDFLAGKAKADATLSQIDEIDNAIDSIDSDVDAELKGSGATASRIRLEKSARTTKINSERTALERKYTTQFNSYNAILTNNASAVAQQNAQK